MDDLGRRARIGVIGCGVVGRLHAQRLAADPRADLVVLADPSPNAARTLSAELRELGPSCRPIVESDPLAAINGHSLDAVVICSPTQAHHAHVLAALEAGVHVLCEKPLATDRDQILDLIRARDRVGRHLLVSYQRRYQAPYVTAWRELTERADRYGPVRQVHVFVCEHWHQTIAGTWRDDPAVGSGYFGDAGSHQIDATFFITGLAPQRLYAVSQRRGARVEIVTQVMAELTQDVRLFAHFVGDAHHWREDIYFHCEKADLLLRNEELFRAQKNQVEPITDLVPDSSPDRAFLDAIVAVAPVAPPSPAECALPMSAWTAAVLRSAATGTWVALEHA